MLQVFFDGSPPPAYKKIHKFHNLSTILIHDSIVDAPLRNYCWSKHSPMILLWSGDFLLHLGHLLSSIGMWSWSVSRSLTHLFQRSFRHFDSGHQDRWHYPDQYSADLLSAERELSTRDSLCDHLIWGSITRSSHDRAFYTYLSKDHWLYLQIFHVKIHFL